MDLSINQLTVEVEEQQLFPQGVRAPQKVLVLNEALKAINNLELGNKIIYIKKTLWIIKISFINRLLSSERLLKKEPLDNKIRYPIPNLNQDWCLLED